MQNSEDGFAVSALRRNAWKAALLGSIGVLSLSVPSLAEARNASRGTVASVTIHVPEQDLETSLLAFARQAHVQIVMNTRVLRGLRSPAVAGTYAPAAALDLIVGASPLSIKWIDAQTVAIAPRAMVQRIAVQNAASMPSPAPAPAMPAGTGGTLEEIVVTAQKRSETLQNVPVAISAIGGGELSRRGIQDIAGLTSSVPNFNFGVYQGAAQLAIRGIGFNSVNPGGEGRVALHLDGVYLSQPSAALNSFYDVERIEVLRGPQGTLYGRNATGGAVNLITAAPTDELSGYFKQTIGNYDLVTSEGAISGGLAPGVSVRLSGQLNERDGFGENIITHNDVDDLSTRAVRGKVRVQESNFELMLSGDYYNEKDHGSGFHLLGTAVPGVPVAGVALGGIAASDPRDVASDSDPRQNRTYWGLGATATLDLGEVKLKSITGYRSGKYGLKGQSMPTTGEFAYTEIFYKTKTFSQEFQLAYESDKVKAVGGLYYFRGRENSGSTVALRGNLFGLPPTLLQGYAGLGVGTTRAAAAFADITYSFTPDLSITIGERVGWERKTVSDLLQFDLARAHDPNNPLMPIATQSARVSDNYHSPKATINYNPSRDLLLYATYSQGYKSGGFDIGSVAPAYKPEKLTNFEVGMKSQWLDDRLRANLSAFLYKYKNIQVSYNDGTVNRIENASSADIYGLEAEVTAILSSAFRIDFSGGYLHSEYKDYVTLDPANAAAGLQNLSGRQLIQAPKFNAQVTPRYAFETPGGGEISLLGTWRYRDRVYFTAFNTKENSARPNSQFDVSLNFADASRRWNVMVWGKNVTDERVTAFSVTGANFFGFPILGFLEPPATYGVTASYSF